MIIDEDILQQNIFNRIYKITEESLRNLVDKDIPEYSEIAREMLLAEGKIYQKVHIKVPPFEYRDDCEALEYYGDENIGDLVQAKTYVKVKDSDTERTVIYYFCPKMLPSMKYIVLSATLNNRIYENYFHEVMPVVLYPEKKGRYTGTLKQYCYHTLGRKSLANRLKVFDVAKEKSSNKDIPVITYMNFERKSTLFDNTNFDLVHFGNSTGMNHLKGKDIAIIGTFYRKDVAYKLVAYYLGANVNQKKDENPRMRRVNYKKKSFLITTYEEPLLQEVQLYGIESEMEQCVGRARLLRCDCTVYLFSSYPCDQAQIYIKDYLL